MDESLFDRWNAIFRFNLTRRSRSARGQDSSAAVSGKSRLLLSGSTVPTLAEQVRKNSECLIADVGSRLISATFPSTIAEWHAVGRHWFDLVNQGVTSDRQYENEYLALEEVRRRHEMIFGDRPLVFDQRYRLWTPPYLKLQIPPLLIHDCLDRFYGSLQTRMDASGNEEAAVATMAYVDHVMDGVIHPWRDGCGRVSTALVMLLAGRTRTFPLFAETFEGHRVTLGDAEGHLAYFRACVIRAKALTH